METTFSKVSYCLFGQKGGVGLGISRRLRKPFFVNGVGILLRIKNLFGNKL